MRKPGDGLESSQTAVEELDSLEQLWLDVDTQDLASQWVPGLKHQRQQHHGEYLSSLAHGKACLILFKCLAILV